MAKIIRLTESDVHRIVKESVERIMKDAGFKSNINEDYPYSPDEDKQDNIDRFERKMKQMNSDWQDKNREIRKKYPGKSREWYEAHLDEEVGAGGGGATNAAGVMQGGGTNPEAGQYTVPAFGVQRRKIYSPKDPTLKRHNGKGGSISIPKERE